MALCEGARSENRAPARREGEEGFGPPDAGISADHSETDVHEEALSVNEG